MRVLKAGNRFGVVLVVLAGVAAVVAASGHPTANVDRADRSAPRPVVNDTDQLIWTYQERIKDFPDDVASYAILGAAYLQRARETGDPAYYRKAEAVLDEALKRDPQHVEALIGMGTLALARHQFRDALALGEQARSINPTIPRIYGVIADAQIELGLYAEAVQSIQTMVDMRPDLSSYSRVSYARELHGDVEGAIAAMQSAVTAGGPTAENTNWTRVQLGHLFLNQGDWVSAETTYRQALAAQPGYVHAEAGLARIYAARREFDQAVQLYTEVVQRMPLAEYVIALGEVYEASGRHAEAQSQFDLVHAIEQLNAANGVDTDLEMVLFTADHLQDQSAEEALARARRAYDKRPTLYAADALAWTLYRAGRYSEAYAWSQRALRLGTQDALLFFHAGMIARETGRIGEARAYLRRALRINPDFSLRYRDVARDTLSALDRRAIMNGR